MLLWLTSLLASAAPCGLFEPGEHLVRRVAETEMVWDLIVDDNNVAWVGTNGAVLRVDGRKVKRFPMPDSQHRRVWALAFDQSGTLWAAADRGLHALRNGKWSDPIALPGEQIPHSLAIDTSDRVWLGTYKQGLWALDPGASALRQVWEGPGSLASDVYNLVVVDDGVLASTRSGFRHLMVDGSVTDIAENHFYRVVYDPYGRLWAADFGTLHLLERRKGKWKEHTTTHPSLLWTSNGTSDRYMVYALDALADGGIVIGTQLHGGTACFDGARWHALPTWETTEATSVRVVRGDRRGRLWIGTGEGVWLVEPANEASRSSQP